MSSDVHDACNGIPIHAYDIALLLLIIDVHQPSRLFANTQPAELEDVGNGIISNLLLQMARRQAEHSRRASSFSTSSHDDAIAIIRDVVDLPLTSDWLERLLSLADRWVAIGAGIETVGKDHFLNKMPFLAAQAYESPIKSARSMLCTTKACLDPVWPRKILASLGQAMLTNVYGRQQMVRSHVMDKILALIVEPAVPLAKAYCMVLDKLTESHQVEVALRLTKMR